MPVYTYPFPSKRFDLNLAKEKESSKPDPSLPNFGVEIWKCFGIGLI